MNLKKSVWILLTFTCIAFVGISNREEGVQAAHQEQVADAAPPPLLFGIANSGDVGTASNFYRIDPSTGVATLIGLVGFRMVSAMDAHPVTRVLYATGRRLSDGALVLMRINETTGAGTEVGRLNIGFNIQDISFRNSDATLFGYQEGRLITINTTTGAGTLIGNVDFFGDGNALAFSPTDTLYHSNDGLFSTLNQTTGAKTIVTNLNFSQITGSFPRVAAMDFQPGTSTLYGSVITGFNNPPTFLTTINTTTGVVNLIGQTVARMDAIAWQPQLPPPPPPDFDSCLKDDSRSNRLQMTLSNGSYQFTNCGGLTIGGTGTVTTKGCLVTLQVNGPDRRILVRMDRCAGTGTASIQVFSSGTTFTIIDGTAGDTGCSCPGT